VKYHRSAAPTGIETATAWAKEKYSGGIMVIDLDQYRKAKKAKAAAATSRYDEELMCVNWTPVRAMSAIFCYRHPHQISPHLPDDLAAIDVDAFIDRVYGLASQI
jgi:hypothetical protein